MDGSFIQQIGKIGNGPGEYGSVLWYGFIDHTNEIILYSYPTGRINVYDAESGEFKRSFRHDFGLKNKVNVYQLELKILPGEIQFPDFLRIGKVLESEESKLEGLTEMDNPIIAFCKLSR